jgi:hypothetical protein
LGAAILLNEGEDLEDRLLMEMSRLMGDTTELSKMRSAYVGLPESLRSSLGATEMATQIIAQAR